MAFCVAVVGILFNFLSLFVGDDILLGKAITLGSVASIVIFGWDDALLVKAMTLGSVTSIAIVFFG
jgi:hypothetical protein